jgi:hypothetical protein
MPALFQAFRHGKLPPGGRIVAVARDERSDEQYRAFIRDRFAAVEEAKQPSAEDSSASPGCCATGAWTSPARGLPGAEGDPGRARRHHRGAVPGHEPAPVPGDLRAARALPG